MNNTALTNNTLRVKESNTNLILDALKSTEIATRSEISKITGLSIATCGNILKELVTSGEILEGDLESGNGGRPARQYIYNKDFSLVTAITIHSDKTLKTLQYAIANLYGEIIEEKIKVYDTIDQNIICDLVSKLINNHKNIKSIGIGIPGFINKNNAIGINDIAELNGVNLVRLLEDKFKIKVAIDRSPAISAYGFYIKYPEFRKDCLATILVPEDHPLGAGFVINGDIYKGNSNVEGEISYVYRRLPKHVSSTINAINDFTDEVLFSISAIISTINPSTIVFMGKSFTEEIYNDICKKCTNIFPDIFIPEFKLVKDYSDVYLTGTMQIAIDCLKPKVKLIAK